MTDNCTHCGMDSHTVLNSMTRQLPNGDGTWRCYQNWCFYNHEDNEYGCRKQDDCCCDTCKPWIPKKIKEQKEVHPMTEKYVVFEDDSKEKLDILHDEYIETSKKLRSQAVSSMTVDEDTLERLDEIRKETNGIINESRQVIINDDDTLENVPENEKLIIGQ